LALQFLNRAALGVQFLSRRHGTSDLLAGPRSERLRHSRKVIQARLDVRQGGAARHGLNTAQAGADARFADDEKEPDLASGVQVGAPAQLGTDAFHADHADAIAVLFAKERHDALAESLLVGGLAHGDGCVRPDARVHDLLHAAQLLRRQRAEVREVKAQPVRGHERAGLGRVRPEHLPQRPMQEVRGRMVPGDIQPALHINRGPHFVSRVDGALEDAAPMDHQTRRRAIRVRYFHLYAGRSQPASVADLTSRFAIERRPLEHDLDVVPRLCLGDHLAIPHDGQDTRVALVGLVPDEGSRRQVQASPGVVLFPDGEALGAAGALLLRRHGLPEAPFVHRQAHLRCGVARHLQGKAVGVVEAEGLRPGHHRAALLAQAPGQVVQPGEADGQRGVEALLLLCHHLPDKALPLDQFGVMVAHGVDD